MKESIVQKVRDIFHQFSIDPKKIFLEEEVNLETEGKLADGTMIYTSGAEWAVGVDVYTKDDSGNAVPLAAGEYELEDGRTVVIGEDTKIAEIKEVEVEVEEEMSTADLIQTIESLSARIAALEGQNTELLSKLSKAEADNVNKSTELSAVKTELSDLKSSAAAPSVKEKSLDVNLSRNQKQTKTTEKPFHRMSMKERIEYNLQNLK
jgi:hypothetical protein